MEKGLKGLTEKEQHTAKIVLDLAEQRPQITVLEMANAANVSKSTVEKVLRILKDEGRIKRSGARRKGEWIVVHET